jgi:hypothetical protein
MLPYGLNNQGSMPGRGNKFSVEVYDLLGSSSEGVPGVTKQKTAPFIVTATTTSTKILSWPQRPDRPWGPSTFLSNGYWKSYPGDKWFGP